MGRNFRNKYVIQYNTPTSEVSAEQNSGSGIVYLGKEFVAGAAGVFEGIGNYFDSLIYKDDPARLEYEMNKSELQHWIQNERNEFNPSKGWEFAGNTAGAIGQATVQLGVSLIPGLGTPLSIAMNYTSAAGNAFASQVQQGVPISDNLYGYANSVGFLEAGTEAIFGVAGKVAGRVTKLGKVGSKAASKGFGNFVVKTAWNTVKDSTSEGLEEGVSYLGDWWLQRAYGINPNAQISFKEFMYEVGVGAVSGAFLSGSTNILSDANTIRQGNKLLKEGNADHTVEMANYYIEGYKTVKGNSYLNGLKQAMNTYNKLENKTGTQGKMMLGKIKAYTSLFSTSTEVLDYRAGLKKALTEDAEHTTAQVNVLLGTEYTTQEILANKDLALDRVAASQFSSSAATGMQLSASLEAAIGSVDLNMSQKYNGTLPDIANGGFASLDLGNGAYAVVVRNGDSFVAAAVDGNKNIGKDGKMIEYGASKSEIEKSLTELHNALVKKAEAESKKQPRKTEKKTETKAEEKPKKSTKSTKKETKSATKSATEKETESEAKKKTEKSVEKGTTKETKKEVEKATEKETKKEAEKKQAEKETKKATEKADVKTEEKSAEKTDVAKAKKKTDAPAEESKVKRSLDSAQKEQILAAAEGNADALDALVNGDKETKAKMQADKVLQARKKTEDAEFKGQETENVPVEQNAVEQEKTASEKLLPLPKEVLKEQPLGDWGEYTAVEQDTARELLPNFDFLNGQKKAAVLAMVRSAKGVDKKTMRFAASMIVARPGLNIYFGESKTDKGMHIKHKGGLRTILVGKDVKKTVLHELWHDLYKTPDGQALVEYVKDSDILKKYREDYAARYKKKFKKDISEELAIEEGIGDMLADYLDKTNFVNRLARTNRGFFVRAIGFLQDLMFSIKNRNDPVYKEAKKLETMFMAAIGEISTEVEAEIRALEGRFDEIELGEIDAKASLSSMAFSFYGKYNYEISDFEGGKYKETEGYKRYVNECLANMSQTSDLDEASARKYIEDSIDGIVRVAVAMKKSGYDILDSEALRKAEDSKGRKLFSSLEPNSDYFTSSDISTICDKRKNFAEIYDDIVRREQELGVPEGKRFFDNVDNYFMIHKLLADKGLTAPCRECYVESMRKNLAPMAKAFVDMIRETDPENTENKQLWQRAKNGAEVYIVGADGKRYTKKVGNAELRENVLRTLEEHPEYEMTADSITVDMLSREDGLAELKVKAPLIYEYFNSFYGQSKPKMPRAATPFRFGELTALLTDNKGRINERIVKKIRSTGGFRLQSYSDFQIQNFADVLQVIFEASTLGLNGHAYTKVPAFLDATKDTNLKRNISIFMYEDGGTWKLDKGDSFPYDLDKIYDIVKEDSDASIIAVVQNESMAAWVMANDNIGYFIPFHKSGIKMGTVRETIVKDGGREILGYKNIKDHTRQQTEVWKETENGHKANTKVDKPINIYEFWDFDNAEGLSKNELIEKNLKEYINRCEAAGYRPKFREYLMNNGKVLSDTLKYAKELGFVSQDATIDDISFKHGEYRIPYGYHKCLGDFGMFTPDGVAMPIETLSLENYDFDAAVKFFEDAETLRRNEILQQIENGAERKRIRESGMTTAQIAEYVSQKRREIVDSVVERRLSIGEIESYDSDSAVKRSLDSVDTEYLSAIERGDVAAEKRMVAEAARAAGYNSPLLYHGTKMFGFTEVKTSGVEKGAVWSPFFAANKEDISASYVPYGKVREISSTMDDDAIEEAREIAIEERKDNISDLVYDFRRLIDRHFSPWVFGQTDNSYLEGLVEKANPEAGNGDGVYDVLSEVVTDAFYDYQDEFGRYEDFDDWSENSPEGKEIFSKIVEIEGEKSALHRLESGEELGGIYQLYANLDNMYVVDGKGVAWDELRPEGLPKIERYGVKDAPYRTRDVAEWARDNGFDGVIFKNIRDNGEYGRTPAGDVYAFFRPESQVKSADPVTYDADGNVIPLSQRFDPENKDIRRSLDIPGAESVTTSMPKPYKEGFGGALRNATLGLRIALTDSFAGVVDYMKASGMSSQEVETAVQNVRSAIARGRSAIEGKMLVGGELKEGLASIFNDIPDDDTRALFYAFLYHRHNVDRMSLQDKSLAELEELGKQVRTAHQAVLKQVGAIKKAGADATDAMYERLEKLVKKERVLKNKQENFVVEENKPVFGETEGRATITAAESQAIADKILAEHPEFEALADRVYAFSDNLMQVRLEAGLVTQEDVDYFKNKYPHYVPTGRQGTPNGIGAIRGKDYVEVKKGIKAATGSGKTLLPIFEQLGKNAIQAYRAAATNKLLGRLYDIAVDAEDTTYVTVASRRKSFGLDPIENDQFTERPKNGQITLYRNGVKVTLNVAPEILAGFQSISDASIGNIRKAAQKVMSFYKSAITSWNPFFIIRNKFRDLQDAGINTKYGRKFWKNIFTLRAEREIANNGQYWQEMRAAGGFTISAFDVDKGMTMDVTKRGFAWSNDKNGVLRKVKHTIDFLKMANDFVEITTRLAEYIAARESGASIEEALLASQEVTTNFGRSGKAVKFLNSYFIPFLNPAVQGASKMVRNILDTNWTAREIGVLLFKIAFAGGFATQILQEILYALSDDEEYEELKDTDKTLYYIIPAGDVFIKIPKGRVSTIFAGAVVQTASAIEGEGFDAKTYLKNIWQNNLPFDSAARSILSPIKDAWTNTTWYGGEIEGREFENVRPENRYDETTSAIAIGIGKLFNISPKRVHYVLDQYTGVFGDVLLPLTSQRAERDPLSANFTIDPVLSNELSTQFYKLYDEAVYSDHEGDEVAYYQKKFLSEYKKSVSDLYKEIDAIEASNLSDSEKKEKVRILRAMINEIYRKALNDYEQFGNSIYEGMLVYGSYATETVTNDNYKSLDLTKDDVGKTVILFDGKVATKKDTKEEADAYVDSNSKKLAYAQTLRLMYGTERGFEALGMEEKAAKITQYGITYDEYWQAYFGVRYISGDDKKQKVIKYLKSIGFTTEKIGVVLHFMGYSGYSHYLK